MKTKRLFSRMSAVSAAFALCVMWTAAAADQTQDTPRPGGLFNALGGLINREAARSANTNQAEAVRDFNGFILQTLPTNNINTNGAAMADRFSQFLNKGTAGQTNDPAASNLVQKLRDWLQSQPSTNSPGTNTAAQRSWMSLTNWLATHSGTNSSGSSGLSGTNLTQKLRDWLAAEQQKRAGNTNQAAALNALSSLLSTNQPSTNVTTPAPATQAVDLFRNLRSTFEKKNPPSQ
jgi:hypothetical protein